MVIPWYLGAVLLLLAKLRLLKCVFVHKNNTKIKKNINVRYNHLKKKNSKQNLE